MLIIHRRLATFLSQAVEQEIPGTFTFDSYFTTAPVLNHIHGHQRAYGGDLKFNRKVWFRGVELNASEMAAPITNQTHWGVTRVLRSYRGRWTGTGHEMDDCQTCPLFATPSRPESSRWQKKDAAPATAGSEIQRTLGLFDGSTP